jgi:predicted helicase
MRHFIKGENIGLLTCRQQSTFDFQHIFVSNIITERCAVSLQTSETTYVFPLYLYTESDELLANERRKPNLNGAIVAEIARRIGLRFTEEKETAKNTFAPLDILDYIYAVLHSPAYRERYKEFLKIDFPRVPYPDDVKTFWKLVKLGARLRRLHLMEGVEPLPNAANFPIEGTNKAESFQYVNGKVCINDTQYFDNVPLEVWDFYIGGYQPAQKWLKDRKGRTLNFDEIQHYQKIVHVLKETIAVMNEIDTHRYFTD